MDRRALIRNLFPIIHLPLQRQDSILALAEDLILRDGSIVFTQGHDDNHVHYLLDGSVELLWNGRAVARVESHYRAARRPLDAPGPKRYTARAKSDAHIVRFERADLEQQIRTAGVTLDQPELEVSEIVTEKSSNWMIRMLQSELFAGLPYRNIQQVFARLVERPVAANELVVRQGDPGDYYYVLEKGHCEVVHKVAGSETEIHLADLGPGDAFGEAALIAEIPRNASVVMLSDGMLMQLSKADFTTLIRDAILQGVDYRDAKALTAADAIWLDVRYPEDFARLAIADSVNISLNVLRLQADKLTKDYLYIVCSDDPKQSAIGAFLLAERGFRVRFLKQAVSDIANIDEQAMRKITEAPGHASGENVIAMPGRTLSVGQSRATQRLEVGNVEDNKGSNPLENTILKIDKLYTEREAETKMQERTPVDDYADTATGKSLADLIDEMDERHANLSDTQQLGAIPVADDAAADEQKPEGLPRGESGTAAASGSGIDTDVIDLSARQRMPIPVAEVKDELAAILHDFEDRLRGFVDSAIKDGNRELIRDHERKIERIREAAALQVRKREAAIRSAYRAKYKEKEDVLRGHYKKVIALANKISEQKAQLQSARRQFEEKLRAANELYRQVEDMRGALRGHLGSLDDVAVSGGSKPPTG